MVYRSHKYSDTPFLDFIRKIFHVQIDCIEVDYLCIRVR